jgi:hypothetical protein
MGQHLPFRLPKADNAATAQAAASKKLALALSCAIYQRFDRSTPREETNMQSSVTTVAEYLAELPPDRRAALTAIRAVILKNLDREYEEGMQYGHIAYYVPHRVYPPGYHANPKQPLPYISLASQKNHLAMYMMGLYCGCGMDGDGITPDAAWFQQAWKATGRKLDMGRACVRFKKLDDVPLEVVGEAVKRIPAKKYIAVYEMGLAMAGKKPARPAAKAKKPNEKKVTAKPSTAKKVAAKKPTVKRSAKAS